MFHSARAKWWLAAVVTLALTGSVHAALPCDADLDDDGAVGITDFLVAYEQVWVRANYSEYFNPTFGLNLRVDWGTNKFYDFYGISASVFKTW